MSLFIRLVGALGPDRTLPERVAMFAAAASVGASFEPGLQPRKTIDQANASVGPRAPLPPQGGRGCPPLTATGTG